MTVLVIDDDSMIRDMLSDAMALWGHTVLQAERGQQGLELFERHSPRIVVTDILMPDIDGLEVLREIKVRDPDTEVIVVTGYGDMARATEALRSDASDFIQKPIRMDALSMALQRAEQRLTMRQQLRQYAENMARMVDERTAELALERNRLQSMIEGLYEGVVLSDEAERIIEMNGWAETWLGVKRDQMLGAPLRTCRPEIAPIVDKAADTFRAHRGESFSAADLELGERWFEVRLSAIRDERGAYLGLVMSLIDITPRKRSETEILEHNRALDAMNARMMALNRSLEQKNQELEDFVYTVSHDLKAPVISFQGFSSLLVRRYAEALDATGRHYLCRIQENADHMERLIGDLLELSRIGRTTEAYEEVDVKEVVHRVLESVRFQLEERDADVQIPEEFPVIRCDRLRLEQVFMNLISNAVKYAHSERPLRIEVGWDEKDGYYRLYVRDNGIGIDPAYHERIFGIFQRLHDVEGVEGTGAGLTIARRIVEYHGGRIWVESERDKGATFYFTLPRGPTSKT